jgi:hypothetical protein
VLVYCEKRVLLADGWFVLREKHCWLTADKPSEEGARSHIAEFHGRRLLYIRSECLTTTFFVSPSEKKGTVVSGRQVKNCQVGDRRGWYYVDVAAMIDWSSRRNCAP